MNQQHVSLSSVPIELIENTLLYLSEDDIRNYCSLNKEGNRIWNDDTFWLNKLDYDYSTVSPSTLILIPSRYVKTMYHPDTKGLDIYRRWKKHFIMLEEKMNSNYNTRQKAMYEESYIHKYTETQNDDIIAFELDRDPPITSKIMSDAIQFGRINILDLLVERGVQILNKYVLLAIKNNQVGVLDWLDEKGFHAKQNYVELAISYDHPNVLEWLEEKGFWPTPQDIRIVPKNTPSKTEIG